MLKYFIQKKLLAKKRMLKSQELVFVCLLGVTEVEKKKAVEDATHCRQELGEVAIIESLSQQQ